MERLRDSRFIALAKATRASNLAKIQFRKTARRRSKKIKSVAEGLEGRDESVALEEAALDLTRLDRYERRAWSRQKSAMRSFMNIKLMKQVGSPAN